MNLKALASARPLVSSLLAERTGFEPVVRLPVRQFSKLLVSATHPPLLAYVSLIVVQM